MANMIRSLLAIPLVAFLIPFFFNLNTFHLFDLDYIKFLIATPPTSIEALTIAFQCTALNLALGPTKVLLPTTEAYLTSSKTWWRVQESSLKPGCIVAPTSTEDVSTILKTFNFIGKKGRGCKFAVRSGGHTNWHAGSNINKGVTISLAALNSVKVAEGTGERTVSVGPGAQWVDVYKETDKFKLAVVGGRSATVGVGGLTLGGGISYYSAKYGFACDNVLSYTIVLANGSIATASATQNKDLYRALKGGGNNLGVVTQFQLRAIPASDFWGGQISYTDSSSPALLKAFAETNVEKFDPAVSIMLGYSFVPSLTSTLGSPFLWSANLEYTENDADPKSFKPFTQVQPQMMNTMRVSNATDFVTEFATFMPPGHRALFITTTSKSTLEWITAIQQEFKKLTSTLEAVSGLAYSLTFQPFSVPELRASQKADDVLGLDASQGPLVLSLISATWDNATDDKAVEGVGKQVHDFINEEGKKRGTYHPYVYYNYASAWQDIVAGYGSSNRDFLRSVSKKYDPDGVFQKQLPGGFKLW